MINKIKKIIGLMSEKNIPKREGEFFEMTVDMSEQMTCDQCTLVHPPYKAQ